MCKIDDVAKRIKSEHDRKGGKKMSMEEALKEARRRQDASITGKKKVAWPWLVLNVRRWGTPLVDSRLVVATATVADELRPTVMRRPRSVSARSEGVELHQ